MKIMDLPASKRCARCSTTKASADFYRNDSQADGLSTYCRTCMSAVTRESYHRHIEKRRKANRERMRIRRVKLKEARGAAREAATA
jgi:hypothetical protein